MWPAGVADSAARPYAPGIGLLPDRYRMSALDRANDFKGKVREMWTVDQVKFHRGTAYFAFTEIGSSPQRAMPPIICIIIISSTVVIGITLSTTVIERFRTHEMKPFRSLVVRSALPPRAA